LAGVCCSGEGRERYILVKLPVRLARDGKVDGEETVSRTDLDLIATFYGDETPQIRTRTGRLPQTLAHSFRGAGHFGVDDDDRPLASLRLSLLSEARRLWRSQTGVGRKECLPVTTMMIASGET
jgi:hypothetical protein